MNFNEKEYLNSFKGEDGINIEGSIFIPSSPLKLFKYSFSLKFIQYPHFYATNI